MASVRRLYNGQVQGPFRDAAGDSSTAVQEAGGGVAVAASADLAPAPSLEVHAANRMMFGPAPGDVQRIQQMGFEAFLAEQLFPESLGDPDCDARLAQLSLTTLGETPAQLYDRRNAAWDETVRPLREVKYAAWVRMLISRRQLFERVVEFWHNHFSIDGGMYIVRSMWPSWDAWLRLHAFGNFRTLLEGTTAHPCMLYFLDNYISTDGGPNENYTREMFELHTLGAMNYEVPGGYIDQDIYEASRCLTGWSFDTGSSSPTRGQFKYKHDDHDRFIKLVLGQIVPGDQVPLKDGRDVLDMVAYHPGTARHVAWKLAVRFIDDDPPASIVDSAAQVFMDNKNSPEQIRWTLYHILNSQEFKDHRMTKFKRPVDWVASLMRAVGMSYPANTTFESLYDNLGMPMFGWRTPDGPPDNSDFWATSNALLQRWNWALRIASGYYESSNIDFPQNMPSGLNAPGDVAQYWSDRVLQRPASAETADAIREFIAEGRSYSLPMPGEEFEDKLEFAPTLACMSPEFMRR
jgi:uncharacterized protein (DUF1800 family)